MNKGTLYECTNCGYQSKAWSGKCFECGHWSTMVQVPEISSSKHDSRSSEIIKPQILKEINIKQTKRESIGIPYLDELLGGGLVPGSVVLLGGEPGIGKSTLALQIAGKSKKALYVCGEESPIQIKERAKRLGIVDSKSIYLLDNIDVVNIINVMKQDKYSIVIVDSVQTIFHPDFPNTPGSPVQLREASMSLVRTARKLEIPIILIGQVTKEGSVAGPRLLEHLVDVMLYLEGERTFGLRMLRSVKNRFNSTSSEIVSLTNEGFKSENRTSWLNEQIAAPGSAVTVTFIGKRPMVIEIQSLVEPMAGNYPKRNCPNLSVSRLDQILAIINSHTKIKIYGHDVFLNIGGGFSVSDPGIDLAIACALISAKLGKSIPANLCLLGELSLTGQVRIPQFYKERINEAKKIGFAKTLQMKYIGEVTNKLFI